MNFVKDYKINFSSFQLYQFKSDVSGVSEIQAKGI